MTVVRFRESFRRRNRGEVAGGLGAMRRGGEAPPRSAWISESKATCLSFKMSVSNREFIASTLFAMVTL